MTYKTGEYCHDAVIWNGKVYDPTNNFYKMNLEEYYQLFRSYGFTGFRFIEDYQLGGN